MNRALLRLHPILRRWRPGQTGGLPWTADFATLHGAMGAVPAPVVYQFHVWLRGISPLIWRRLLVPSYQTVADLHYTLQIAFGWSDYHLHRFRIHGKDYGLRTAGGPWFADDAHRVRLADFRFRVNERFLYEYDFGDNWQHEVRVERLLAVKPQRIYPVCIGGRRATPPEDCGGPWAFQEHRDEAPWRAQELLDQIAECVRARDITALQDRIGEIPAIQEWLNSGQVRPPQSEPPPAAVWQRR